MEYSHLTKDQQRQILKGRVTGWEADHFGHEINLAALLAAKTEPDGLENTYKALAALEASIIAGREKLMALGEDDSSSES